MLLINRLMPLINNELIYQYITKYGDMWPYIGDLLLYFLEGPEEPGPMQYKNFFVGPSFNSRRCCYSSVEIRQSIANTLLFNKFDFPWIYKRVRCEKKGDQKSECQLVRGLRQHIKLLLSPKRRAGAGVGVRMCWDGVGSSSWTQKYKSNI